jgi:hypothetical protein
VEKYPMLVFSFWYFFHIKLNILEQKKTTSEKYEGGRVKYKAINLNKIEAISSV